MRLRLLSRLHYRRSLASRVILLTTFAVGLSVALVALAAYLTVRHQLQATMDRSLHQRAYVSAQHRPGAVLRQRRAGVPAGSHRQQGRLPVRERPRGHHRWTERRQDRPRQPGARGRPRRPEVVVPHDRGQQRHRLPGRHRADQHRRGGVRRRAVDGVQRAHPRQARPDPVHLRRSRGDRRRPSPAGVWRATACGRCVASPTPPRRSRAPRSSTPSTSRATTRSPGWPARSTRCSPRCPRRGTGSGSWSPTPATSCAHR